MILRAVIITSVLIWLAALWLLFPPRVDAPARVVQPVSAPVPPHLAVPKERQALPALAPIHAEARMPAASYRYRRAVHHAAARAFGHQDAPAALLAAQLRQESAYRSDATSHAGAQGIAQFMPATAALMADRYPELRPAAPRDPSWATLAQALHMRDLYELYPDAATRCDRWALALSAYNGGPVRLRRERLAAQHAGQHPGRWADVSPQRARGKGAWVENRGYVQRVLYTLEPRYARAGWTGGLSCQA